MEQPVQLSNVKEKREVTDPGLVSSIDISMGTEAIHETVSG